MDKVEEIKVRNSRSYNLLFGLLTLFFLLSFIFGPYKVTIAGFEKNFHGNSILFLVFTAGTIFFWFRFFDRKPKLIFTKTGIWHPKMGNCSWENVWYIESITTKSGDQKGSDVMYLKLYGEEKPIELIIDELNVSINQIRYFIETHKRAAKIIDLGHTVI